MVDPVVLTAMCLSIGALAGVVFIFIELRTMGAGVAKLGASVSQIGAELKRLSGGK